MKKIILLALVFLLTACSFGKPTKESETEKFENYLEEISWVRQSEYSKNFIHEVTGNYEDYPHVDTDYYFYEINVDNLTYAETYNTFDRTNNNSNSYKFTYDYKQDLAKGTYTQNFDYTGIGNDITHIYMYDYKNGITECTRKENIGTIVSECNISGEALGDFFLKTKQRFLDILEKSGVDKEILLQ